MGQSWHLYLAGTPPGGKAWGGRGGGRLRGHSRRELVAGTAGMQVDAGRGARTGYMRQRERGQVTGGGNSKVPGVSL